MKTRLTFRDPKLEALRAIPAFASLPARRLDEVAPLLDELDVPAGRELMREGDRSREFLFIVEGSVRVMRDDATVAILGPGDVVGETGVLTGARRNATAYALTPLHVLVGTSRVMDAVREADVTVAATLDETVAARRLTPQAA